MHFSNEYTTNYNGAFGITREHVGIVERVSSERNWAFQLHKLYDDGTVQSLPVVGEDPTDLCNAFCQAGAPFAVGSWWAGLWDNVLAWEEEERAG